MSRSGYTDDYCENTWARIRWRGAVNSAMRGKKGQAFFKEMLATLDAMPEKKLVKEQLVSQTFVQTPGGLQPKLEMCAIGAICVARGVDVFDLDIDDFEAIAERLGINSKIVQEVEWENDEAVLCQIVDNKWKYPEDPDARRWQMMRDWVASQIKEEKAKQ